MKTATTGTNKSPPVTTDTTKFTSERPSVLHSRGGSIVGLNNTKSNLMSSSSNTLSQNKYKDN